MVIIHEDQSPEFSRIVKWKGCNQDTWYKATYRYCWRPRGKRSRKRRECISEEVQRGLNTLDLLKLCQTDSCGRRASGSATDGKPVTLGRMAPVQEGTEDNGLYYSRSKHACKGVSTAHGYIFYTARREGKNLTTMRTRQSWEDCMVNGIFNWSKPLSTIWGHGNQPGRICVSDRYAQGHPFGRRQKTDFFQKIRKTKKDWTKDNFSSRSKFWKGQIPGEMMWKGGYIRPLIWWLQKACESLYEE